VFILDCDMFVDEVIDVWNVMIGGDKLFMVMIGNAGDDFGSAVAGERNILFFQDLDGRILNDLFVLAVHRKKQKSHEPAPESGYLYGQAPDEQHIQRALHINADAGLSFIGDGDHSGHLFFI